MGGALLITKPITCFSNGILWPDGLMFLSHYWVSSADDVLFFQTACALKQPLPDVRNPIDMAMLAQQISEFPNNLTFYDVLKK